MKLDKDIQFLFELDFSRFADLKEKITHIDWADDRLTRGDNLNLIGRSAVIFFDFIPSTVVNYHQILDKNLEKIKRESQDLVNHILSYFDGFVPVKGELSCCFPKSSQKLHIDPRIFHRYCKRIHLPLITNNDAYLEIESNRYHLEENKIYEFNNMLNHRSVNHGEEKRIHLILDIIKEDELKKCMAKFGKMFFVRVPGEFEWQSLD